MMGQQMANQMAQGMNQSSQMAQQGGQMNQMQQNMAGQANQAVPKFCPNCGTPTNGANFCGNCGQKLV